MIQAFRIMGWLEGLSFLALLFIAMPMKYALGDPQMVKLMGPLHGFLFLGYLLLGHYVADKLGWNLKTRFYAFIAAVLPFGTFVFERKYLAKNTTAGAAQA